MNLTYKITDNSVQLRERIVDGEADEAAALPIDQQALLNALGDAMGILAAEERTQREQQISELREKTAMLEGRVDALMLLMQGKGQVIDLPPLPRAEADDELVRKARLS